MEDADLGFVGAMIDPGEAAFDSGGFFGDMAPLADGLGGALEDGLEAPPEELLARERGGLEDEDLPIEALMDDEDDDLSLAALLRRRAAGDAGASSSGGAKADGINGHSLSQPLMPPMPPQPQMLAQLGHHQQPLPQQQQQHAPAKAAPAPAPVLDVQQQQLTPQQPQRAAAPGPPSSGGIMTAGELEARMLRSAEAAAAAAAPPPSEARGGQLLSMPQGSGQAPPQQQQQHMQQQHHHQMQMQHQGMPGPAGGPLGPPFPGQMQGPPFGPHPDMLSHMHQQQHQQRPPMAQQQLPGMPGLGGPHPMPPPPGHPMGPHPSMPPLGPHGPPPPHMGGPMPPPHHQQQQPGMMMMPPRGPEPHGPPGHQPPLPGQLGPPGGMMMPGPHGFPGGGMPPQAGTPPGKAPPPGYGPPGASPAAFMQQQQQLPPPGTPGLPGAPPQPSPMHQGRPPHTPPPHFQQQPQPHHHRHQQHLPEWALPGASPAGAPDGAARVLMQQQQQDFGLELTPGGQQPGEGPQQQHDRAPHPAALVNRLRSFGSAWMSADDVCYVLRIQHMSTHSGLPYVEDFYYQAFLNKYLGGRNALIFAPQALRALPGALGGGEELGDEPRFADLAGLGKIVLTNIRTPKLLMDLGGDGKDGGSKGAAGGSGAGSARPLEQEPMLAARIMVEDCMLLLADVEDIDRTFAASVAAAGAPGPLPPVAPVPLGREQGAALLHRRAALLGGIAASFRLPDAPVGGGSGGAAGGSGDGVFLRILALPKGRALVSKTLRLMFTPPAALPGAAGRDAAAAARAAAAAGDAATSLAQGLDVIWALLRNARAAFGPPVVAATGEAERRLTEATVALSASASEIVKRLRQPHEAVACLAACIAGLSPEEAAAPAGDGAADGAAAAAANGAGTSQLLPLYPAGRAPGGGSPEWLSSILGSLLLRASELGLGSFAAEAAAGPQRGLGDGDDDAAGAAAGGGAAAAGVPAAVAGEWQALTARLTHLLQLHLWQLVLAARGEAAAVAAAAGGGAGAGDVLSGCLPKLACVPLMRVLMSHCDAVEAGQIKAYLAEIGGR